MNNQVTIVGSVTSVDLRELSVAVDNVNIKVITPEELNIKVGDCLLIRGQYKEVVYSTSIRKLNYDDTYNDVFIEGTVSSVYGNRFIISSDNVSINCICRLSKYMITLKRGDTVRVAGSICNNGIKVNLIEVVTDEVQIRDMREL